MFRYCVNLKSLDLSGWDTSNVEYISSIFCGCEKLKSLDLSGWNISHIKKKGGMFSKCPAPYEVIDNKIVKK